MPDWKHYKALIALILLIIPPVVGAVLYFSPMSYAEETRQLVMQLSAQQQVKWMQGEVSKFRWECVDKFTDEWICSDKRKLIFDELIFDVNIKRQELGLPLLNENGDPKREE